MRGAYRVLVTGVCFIVMAFGLYMVPATFHLL
jgi:hypothetical protein